MKRGDEILAMILETIAQIYRRPTMYAWGSDGVDDVLWHLHALWLRGMGLDDMDRLHWALDQFEETWQAMNFPTYYRNLRDREGEVDDAAVVRYVVDKWREMDEKLGIELPPSLVEVPRP